MKSLSIALLATILGFIAVLVERALSDTHRGGNGIHEEHEVHGSYKTSVEPVYVESLRDIEPIRGSVPDTTQGVMDKRVLSGIRKEREEWNTRTRCLRELLIGDTKDERDKSSTSASGTANRGRATGDCTAKKSSDSASRTSRAVGNP